MYQKYLRDQKTVFFRYSPPLTERDGSGSDKLPNQPFAGAEPWQCSVYYYWWLFWRECQSDPNYRIRNPLNPFDENLSPAGRIEEVFGSAHKRGFLCWWIKFGRHLFCEPIRHGVRPLQYEELDRGVYEKNSSNIYLEDTNIYLVIPVHQDFEKSIEEVRFFLKKAKAQKSAMTYDEPLFPVFTKPVLTSLEKIYQAWVLRASYPEMPLADIAMEAGLASSSDNNNSATRASNASAASRALKQASLIIKWVEHGVFPVTSSTQEGKAAQMAERQQMKLKTKSIMTAFKKLHQDDNSEKFLYDLATSYGFDLDAVR